MCEVRICVATHKEVNELKKKLPKCYSLIQVGASLNKVRFGYICDNTGNNISSKNPFYCELTALYWMWKNSNADIKGLVHYRRFLTNYSFSISAEDALKEKEIRHLLEKSDVILPYTFEHPGLSNYEYYFKHGAGKEVDMCHLREIMSHYYSDYLTVYDEIMKKEYASYCNVMICRKEIFDSYCEWLFDILFKLENVTDLTAYTKQEARIYGYISEILLNVWVKKQQLSIVYKPLNFLNNKVPKLYSIRKVAERSRIVENYKLCRIKRI